MRRSVAATVVLLSAFVAAQVRDPDTLVSLTTADWPSFDPAQCYDPACEEVLQNTLETLYQPSQAAIERAGSAKVSYLPLLASALPAISDSGRTFTVHLRTNAQFRDGTPVTSTDVKYSFMRLMLTSAQGGAASLLLEPFLGSTAPILKTDTGAFHRLDRAIQTPTPTTVVFHLAKPFAPFVPVLANPAASIYSEAAAVRVGAWDGRENTWQRHSNEPLGNSPFLSKTPLGSGPLLLERYDKAQQVVLQRSDRYWRMPAKLQRVVIKLVTKPSTAAQLIKTGDADQTLVGAYPRNVQGLFQTLPGVTVLDDVPPLTLTGLYMNFDIKDPSKLGPGTLSEQGIPATFFADRNVRLGFAHSFDYDGFVRQQLLGKARINNTVINSVLPGYDPALRYTFDRMAATNAFRRAWGGKLWKSGFTVSVAWDSSDASRQQADQMLKANIEALNPRFHVNVQQAEFSQVLADAVAGRASVWIGLWQADYADPYNFAQPLVASDGLLGAWTGYRNTTVDVLIAQALAEASASRRAALYRQISQLAFNDVAEIPLYQTVAYTVQRAWVRGRTYSPLNGGDYYYSSSK